ncbi:hypothetical protein CR983_00450 [Candidatus Saccharibacteria bacterium]|nr:MAG: hypothetical protein CR983_00450 [Candidatus Saccharibacteria bacterium]
MSKTAKSKSKKPAATRRKTPRRVRARTELPPDLLDKHPVVVAAHRARRHYWRIMPDALLWHVVFWVVFTASALVIAAQLLYPPDRALPRAELAGDSVGWQQYDTLAARFNTLFQQSSLRLKSDEQHAVELKLRQLGAELQTDVATQQLIEYPWWQRLIPFSIFWHAPRVEVLPIRYTSSILDEKLASLADKLSFEKTNAQLAIRDGKLVAEHEAPGSVVEATTLRKTIVESEYRVGLTTLAVTSKAVAPDTTSADLAEVRAQAETALSRPVRIVVGDTTHTPPTQERATWLQLIAKDGTNIPTIDLNKKSIREYLATLNKTVAVAAGTTHIRLVNGVEAERKEGAPGKTLDIDAMTGELEKWLLRGEGNGSIQGRLIPTKPKIVFNSRYTSDQAGLQAYVNDTAANHNASIVVKQLAGPGWSADANGGRSTVSASTYKLYVALVLFDKLQKGETSWNAPMLGTTVSGCFDRMTIASTNPCAENWINQWGRSYINSYIYDKGFSRGTTFINPIAVHTTARDLARYMEGLEKGTLVSGAYRDRLLHSLASHRYRWGVPTGSTAAVYDKVGFLWDYTHDAAIVRHPRGTYIIVVMTKGRSYATIAMITREVEKLLYP